MKALTLTQPWATLVAIGAKQVETRSWHTGYRGPVAIHAAKGFPMWARDTCDEEPFASVLRAAGYPLAGDLPIGAVLATAKLVECHPTAQRVGGMAPLWVVELSSQEHAFGDYSSLRFGWFLEDITPLPEPVPARGSLGLWEWRT